MLRSTRRLLAALLAVVPLVGHTPAREKPRFSPLVQRERTILVLADVEVEDRDGRPITGLRSEDFILLADGRVRAIESFDEIGVAAEGESGPPGEPGAGTFVFFFDNALSNHFERRQAARAADRMLESVLRPDDRFTALALGRRFKVVSPMRRVADRTFTSFSELLADPEVQDPYTDGHGARLREVRELMQLDPEKGMHLARALATEEGSRVHKVLDVVRSILTALEPIRERKHLIYLSSGVPRSPGADYLEAAGLRNEGFSGTRTTEFALRRLFREANSGRISVVAVDLAGLEAGTTALDAVGARSGLISLAVNTGGQAIVNTNDLAGAVGEALNASRHYYLLGFSPESGGDGEYHGIEVRVRDPEWRVRARGGFLDFTSSQLDERQIMGSFVLPEMFDELPVSLEVVPLERRGGKWLAQVQVRVPLGSLERLPGSDGTSGQVELGASLFRGARQASRFDRAVTLSFPDGPAPQGEIVLQETARLNEGSYIGLAVARDIVGGVVGGARLELELPDAVPGRLQVALGTLVRDDVLPPRPRGSRPPRDPRLLAAERRVIWSAEPLPAFEGDDVIVFAYLLPDEGREPPRIAHRLLLGGELLRTSHPSLKPVGKRGRDLAAYEQIRADDLEPGVYSMIVVRGEGPGEEEAGVAFRVRGEDGGEAAPSR